MPLSETNKAQSQSIEDLIAQLDLPNQATGANNGEQQSQQQQQSQINGSSSNTNGHSNANSLNRKQVKGRRVNSTSFSYSTNVNGSSMSNSSSSSTSNSLFSKTNSFGQNSEPLLSKNIITSKKYSKKLGRLRDKGMPKKDGAGGKHTWGKAGCELTVDYLDSKDPNYDSEEAGNVVMVCVETDGNRKLTNGSNSKYLVSDDENDNGQLKQLDMDELDVEIKPVILEYFQNGDAIEVIDHLKKYNLSGLRAPLVNYLVQLALEKNNTSKELVSRLLRDLTFELFRENDYVMGFDLLFKNLPDLTLDNPDAPEKTGTFVARAIADKVINKSYLDRFYTASEASQELPDMNNEKIAKAVESARLLVNMNNHLYHLSHIWGNKGGFLAVQELTDKINEIIQEYHDSADVNEAIRCLKELNVPHFHHEFVFEAIDFALQKGNDHSIDLITDLLHRLCQAVIITYDQLKMVILNYFFFPLLIHISQCL
jgi:programmed cell death protein 4